METFMDESQAQQQAEHERQRKARFSEEENDVLINSILPHYDKLFGKLAARTSTAVKNALWREIAAAVNAISAYPRSLQNCKKRYADVKRKVKEKLCKIAKHSLATGDRAPLSISFWPYERIMEKIISAEVVAGVPGATDSGRMAEPNAAGPSDFDAGSEYFTDIQDGSESARSEIEDPQMPIHHFPVDKEDHGISHMEGGLPHPQEETQIVQEEPLRERRPNACRVDPSQRSRELWSTRHHHSVRDHTTLIYAEQSHFRRTMAKKLDILNNNVKALNKNVKAFQHSFNQSIMALSQSMQQQNSIFEKLSSNLLLMAQQQQQHNQLCTTAIKQLFQIFPSSRDSVPLSMPNEMPSDATSEMETLKDLPAQKEPCAHEVTGPRRPSSPSGEAPKRRRH
ncbi:myb-related transcription factor, partner of profilin isoform X2 [Xenopus laevis]|nr:myb-related transcription factor, partner of profilin isoform X2 [Xenopus laevis]XP_018121590.1 myb-related transcription factor, partner of profilin isoform X2 [Xenopus laevis]